MRPDTTYLDIVERVLDKGIVIDARMRVSLGGIDLVTIEAHVIVASIETYLWHWPARDGAAILANTPSIVERG